MGVALITVSRCYSEMTADEESKGLLVYDESLQGCGNGMFLVPSTYIALT